MQIIYNKYGKIIDFGAFEENSTHYIKEDTYFDKKTCFVSSVENIDNFNKDDWEFVNSSLQEIKKVILSKAEFFKLLTWEEQLKIRNYQNYINEPDKIEAFTVLYENFKDFKEVDLSDTAWVQDFAQIVIWCGILTAERVQEIIGA